MSILALDLGSRELKLLEGDGRRLIRHVEILLPDGAMVDGMPSPLLTASIRSAHESSGFASRRIRLAIPETGTAVRDFVLPPLPASELEDAVLYEGRRLVPMEASDIYFAWHAARVSAGYQVYLVAARRGMIDAISSAVTAAGLQVDRIDLKPLALARGMGARDGLLLEWGGSEASLVLMAGGRPKFFRTFLLDAPPDEVEAQFNELVLSVNALLRFIRGVEAQLTIPASSTICLAGRFAFIEGGLEEAQRRFPFTVTQPAAPAQVPAGFPWQAHLAGLGLMKPGRWHDRLTPSQGGDMRVAA
jgi:type IV pilus assembly PilM-like protein